MKAEHWMDAMGQIDMSLVAEAEQRCLTTPVRRPPRKLLRWAACLAVALLLSLSVAFAAGVFDPLSQYFQGRTEADWDRFLSASTSVANDTVSILAETAERADEIDVERARRALERAQAAGSAADEEDSEHDWSNAERRAESRLRAAEGRRGDGVRQRDAVECVVEAHALAVVLAGAVAYTAAQLRPASRKS